MKNNNAMNGSKNLKEEGAIKEKPLEKIYANYKNIEKSIVDQLLIEVPNHYLTQGTYRETVWKSLFEKIIPKKFCIDQGVFIIDSKGHISDEVDLAIFDEQYTPYIFNYGKIKFIPIEAVAVVIQCKSNELKNCNLEEWANSIEKLSTSTNSIVRTIKGLTCEDKERATRPIKILCTTHNNKYGVSDDFAKIFDICINIDKNKNCLVKKISNEESSYDKWYKKLNYLNVNKNNQLINKTLLDIKITDNNGNENVILSLIFQLNQLLMLINNPMLFPHESYAKLFNGIGKKIS